MTFGRAVTLVEVLGGCRHVDEGDTLGGSQLFHLVAVVHRVVIGRNAQVRLQFTVDNGIVFVA